MSDIDERGLKSVMQDAIELAHDGTAGFHLSFDMDVVDPDEAPGVGTPVRGGMTYREAHLPWKPSATRAAWFRWSSSR